MSAWCNQIINWLMRSRVRKRILKDGRAGSTKYLSTHLENNCTGTIYLIQLFWNSRIYWMLVSSRKGLDGKLWFISINFRYLYSSNYPASIVSPMASSCVSLLVSFHTACRSRVGKKDHVLQILGIHVLIPECCF